MNLSNIDQTTQQTLTLTGLVHVLVLFANVIYYSIASVGTIWEHSLYLLQSYPFANVFILSLFGRPVYVCYIMTAM